MTLANLMATGVAAGKVFFGGHGSFSYHVTKRVLVPKFNDGDKNPFAARAAAVEKTSPPGVAVARNPQKARPARMTSWAGKLNLFRAPAPVKSFRRAEQTELSLQLVKVLRNDLAESDIERVPAKSCTLPLPPIQSTVGAWEVMANAS